MEEKVERMFVSFIFTLFGVYICISRFKMGVFTFV